MRWTGVTVLRSSQMTLPCLRRLRRATQSLSSLRLLAGRPSGCD